MGKDHKCMKKKGQRAMKMCNRTENNREKAEKLIHALFKGTGLSSFSFGTSFALRFSRDGFAEFEGNVLPGMFEIQILSDWWFGSRDEWQFRVNQFDTRHMVEPDEPVKAFELASIRWMEGSDIDRVKIDEEVLVIQFRNGKSLTISLFSEADDAWVIKGVGLSESINMWSITCDEDGELYVHIP